MAGESNLGNFQIKDTETGSTATGFAGLNASGIGDKLSAATTALNTSLASMDASDPGQLIKMQQELAIYTTGIGVIAAINKAIEDCLKGVTQKLG